MLDKKEKLYCVLGEYIHKYSFLELHVRLLHKIFLPNENVLRRNNNKIGDFVNGIQKEVKKNYNTNDDRTKKFLKHLDEVLDRRNERNEILHSVVIKPEFLSKEQVKFLDFLSSAKKGSLDYKNYTLADISERTKSLKELNAILGGVWVSFLNSKRSKPKVC